jgi:NTP pyrophosphatase (non-canonical NTP hydrolase)
MKKEQEKVNEWVSQYKIGYFKPLEILAQITEEVGELARELNHTYGPKKKKQSEQKNEIGEEMADIIFAIICLANSLDIDLDNKFEAIVDKRYSRDKDRWERK